MQRCVLVLVVLAALQTNLAAAQNELVGTLAVPGNATDFFPGVGVNQNRLGGFGSALHYDATNNEYYGLVDRGPGGGVVPFEMRMQVFGLDINPATGAPSNFLLKKTIPLRSADGSTPFNGLAPGRLNGDPHVLGMSLDSEGMAVGPNGHFYIADEYGPALYEFSPVDVSGTTQARFVRSFTIPDRLLPRDSQGNIDYDAVRAPAALPDGMPDLASTLVSGRQDNRGFEGVTITPDGTKLWATLQDPIAEEGSGNQGRRSKHMRLVEFDVATGAAGRQVIYPLTLDSVVNAVIDQTNPDPAADILPTGQGRNILVSEILAISNTQFLMLERDGRGIGAENPAGADPIGGAAGIKYIFRIDISGATDVSGISLKGTNSLTTPALPGNPDPPITITPVFKEGFFDLLAAFKAQGLTIPEKVESMTWGPTLADGRRTLVLATDNDVSVSQAVVQEGGQRVERQFEIYTMGNQTRYTDLDDTSKSYSEILNTMSPDYLVDQGPLPVGFAPLPTYIYSVAVPEPSSWLLATAGAVSAAAIWRRRRRSPSA